jgi:hypothetical protein
MVMRRLLGPLLALALLLAGCGDDTPERAGDGASSSPASPSPTATGTPEEGPVDFTLVALVSESNVGGEVDPAATLLDSDRAVADFAARFDDPRMLERLQAEVAEADVPDGQALVGAVVAIACDAPAEVYVEWTGSGLQVTGSRVKTDKQCLVPVTTVALVAVDAELVVPRR